VTRMVKTNRDPFIEVILSNMLDNSLEGENSWLVQNAAMFPLGGLILPKGPPGLTRAI
jgi:hypothetical protein